MKLTKNKGEWSEFYVLLKVLVDKKLYAADEDLNVISDVFYPILTVIAGKDTVNQRNYELSESSDDIKILDPKDGNFKTINKSVIQTKLRDIFQIIKDSAKTFEIQSAEDLRNQLECITIKSGSNKKTDIVMIVHDWATGMKPEIGFSIKSKVGSDATLFNAGKNTNLTFEIIGGKIDISKINNISSSSKVRDRIKEIEGSGGSLEYHSMEGKILEKNLRMIDLTMPEIISEMLKIFYEGKAKKVSDIVTELERENPLQKTLPNFDPDFYKHKIEQFLVAAALGMMPGKPWDGRIETLGGYIIVKEDGEVVCYHLLNLDQFKEYLFKNTRLETASTTRHGFATAYEEDGKLFMKLNFQVRFTE